MRLIAKIALIGMLIVAASLHALGADLCLEPGQLQPKQNCVFEKPVQLGSGNNRIFDKNLSVSALKERLYSVDGQRINLVLWDPSGARPLVIGEGATLNDAAITWKFKAPPGQIFKGGLILFNGTSNGTGRRLKLQVHSAYSSNGEGKGGYLGSPGQLYSSDIHGPMSDWQSSTWTAPVPVDANEFYVTVAMEDDYGAGFGIQMDINGVALEKGVPAIARRLISAHERLEMYPPGWTGDGPWEKDDFHAGKPQYSDAAQNGSISCLRLQLGNPGEWKLYAADKVDIVGTWTFTAVVAARNLGWVNNQPSLKAVILGSGGQTLSETVLDGLNLSGWTKISVSYTASSGVASVQPGFKGAGGGDFCVQSAVFKPESNAYPLAIPTGAFPSGGFYDVSAQLSRWNSNWGGIYDPGAIIQWKIASGLQNDAIWSYSVRDAYGNSQGTGTFNTMGIASFFPSKRGYFEIVVNQDVNGLGRVKGRTGAMVLGDVSNWVAGESQFGMPDIGDDMLQRLGMGWTRKTYFNILDGSHSRLPPVSNYAERTVYSNAWRDRINASLPESDVLSPTKVGAVEVWNEPYNEIPGLDMDQFVNMLEATTDGIGSSNRRDLKVAANFEWPDYFQALHNSLGWKYYSIATIHPYTTGVMRSTSTESPEADKLLNRLQEFRNVILNPNHQVPPKEIWSNEFGWPTYAYDCRPVYAVTELTQARYLVRSALLQLGMNIKRVLPFDSQDKPFRGHKEGSFGLMRLEGSPKPALTAYAVLSQTIYDLPYNGYWLLGNGKVPALLFGKPNGMRSVLAFWTPYDPDYGLTLTLPPGPKKEIGLFGEVQEFGSSGEVAPSARSVTAMRSVTYLTCNCSPESFQNALGGGFNASILSTALFQDVSDNPVHSDGVPACPQNP